MNKIKKYDPQNLTKEILAGMIDNTLLKPFATSEKVREFCMASRNDGYASICINPVHVPLAAECLQGTETRVCTVVGFPLGANTTEVKTRETVIALEQGATEIDMVINIGWLKSAAFISIEKEIKSLLKEVGDNTLKVIIETCFLDYQEKADICKLIIDSGAHFVKTSTGFGTGGATVEDIRLLKDLVGDQIKIKASGGIGNLQKAIDLLNSGADRLGTSSGRLLLDSLYY